MSTTHETGKNTTATGHQIFYLSKASKNRYKKTYFHETCNQHICKLHNHNNLFLKIFYTYDILNSTSSFLFNQSSANRGRPDFLGSFRFRFRF